VEVRVPVVFVEEREVAREGGVFAGAGAEVGVHGRAGGRLVRALAPHRVLTGALALVGFGVRQTRSLAPVADLLLYRDRRFSGASFAVAVMTVATGSTLFILSQYPQLVLGYCAFETGLTAVPLAAGVVAGSAIGGRAPARFGARACIVAGFAVTAAGFAVLASLSEGSGYAAVSAGLGGLLATACRDALPGSLPDHAMTSLGATLPYARDRAGGGPGPVRPWPPSPCRAAPGGASGEEPYVGRGEA
jgi:hypothetical protein